MCNDYAGMRRARRQRWLAAVRGGGLVAAMAAALLPGLAAAQQPAGDAELRPTPLERLLQERDALGLTAAQVRQVEEIRTRLETRNAPLVRRLMVLRAAWHDERAALQQAGRQHSPRLQQLRLRSEPVLRQVQVNNRAAMGAANQVLTVEQRQRLRDIIESRRPRDSHGW